MNLKTDYKDIFNKIEVGEITNLYLIYGKEKYLLDNFLKKIKDKYIEKNFEELNYIILKGERANFQKLKEAEETMPFMSDKKIIIVEDLNVLTGNKDGDLELEFLEFIKNIGKDSIVILNITEDSIDKRKKIFKEIAKCGVVLEFSKLEEKGLSNWIRKKLIGKKIREKEINQIIYNIGYMEKNSEISMYTLENELKKLLSYVGEREEITEDDIENSVSKSIYSTIFALVENIGIKNSKTIRKYNQLLESGTANQMILYMIIRQMRLMLGVVLYLEKGYTEKQIKEKMGIKFDFLLTKLIRQGKVLTKVKIVTGLEKLLEIDKKIKQTSLDEKILIEKFLVEMENM